MYIEFLGPHSSGFESGLWQTGGRKVSDRLGPFWSGLRLSRRFSLLPLISIASQRKEKSRRKNPQTRANKVRIF